MNEYRDKSRQGTALAQWTTMVGARRIITLTFMGLMASLALGIVLLIFEQPLLATPFLIIGGFGGTVGIFILPVVLAVIWVSRRRADEEQFPIAPSRPMAAVARSTAPLADTSGLEDERVKLVAQMQAPMRLVKGAIVVGTAALVVGKLFLGWDIDLVPLIMLPILLWVGGDFLVKRPYQFAFAELFKDKVLPGLVSQHGEFARLRNFAPTFERERTLGVVPPHIRALVDDAFSGTVRGAEVTLAEIKFQRPQKDADVQRAHTDERPEAIARMMNRHVSGVDTLAIWVKLNGRLPATTVLRIVANKLSLGLPAGLQVLHLEDPEFAGIYQALGSDQIQSRALLTPASMRALISMADNTGLMPPTLLAEDDRMMLVLTNPMRRDLFEPGSVTRPGSDDHLRRIETDLAIAFGLVNALLDVAEVTPGAHIAPVKEMP